MPIVAHPALITFRRRNDAASDPFIAEVAAHSFAEYDSNCVQTTRRMLSTGTTWLAWRGAEPLGFAIVHARAPSELELCAIAVTERARGQGVAAALLRRIEDELSLAGGGQIRLHTAQANLAALELFLKRGFRVERRLPRFYRGVFDACALCKRVPRAAPGV